MVRDLARNLGLRMTGLDAKHRFTQSGNAILQVKQLTNDNLYCRYSSSLFSCHERIKLRLSSDIMMA